jgi:hypothetical protein
MTVPTYDAPPPPHPPLQPPFGTVVPALAPEQRSNRGLLIALVIVSALLLVVAGVAGTLLLTRDTPAKPKTTAPISGMSAYEGGYKVGSEIATDELAKGRSAYQIREAMPEGCRAAVENAPILLQVEDREDLIRGCADGGLSVVGAG